MTPILGARIPIAAVSGRVTLTKYLKSLSSTVGLWSFDETSGNLINLAPATLGSLDGVPAGPTQGATGPGGDAGLSYSYDGGGAANDTVALANDATLAGMIDQTWGFLINLASTGEGGAARVLSWTNLAGYYFRTSGAERYRWLVDYDTTDAVAQTAGSTLPLDTWHWIIFGHDGTTKKNLIYQGLNSVLTAFVLTTDTTGVGTLQTPPGVLEFGNNQSLTATIDGSIAYAFALNVAPDTVTTELAQVVRLTGV